MVVDTPRLTLRCWTFADVDPMSEAIVASADHLRPWMWWAADEPITPTARRAVIARMVDEWASGGDATYGVFLDDRVVGGCGLHRRRGPTVLEIGYWIHVAHLRQGYASELAAALTTTALDQPGIDRVEIHHDRANEASRAVPERLGFHFAGESPVEPRAPAETGVHCCWYTTSGIWQPPALGGGHGAIVGVG